VIREETIAANGRRDSCLWTVDPVPRFPYIRALDFNCFAAARGLSV
jgi:hypothetical protein